MHTQPASSPIHSHSPVVIASTSQKGVKRKHEAQDCSPRKKARQGSIPEERTSKVSNSISWTVPVIIIHPAQDDSPQQPFNGKKEILPLKQKINALPLECHETLEDLDCPEKPTSSPKKVALKVKLLKVQQKTVRTGL